MVKNVELKRANISKYLHYDQDLLNVQILHETVSTNDDAKKLHLNQSEAIALVATNKQTAGRGRRGKSFYSELAHGLYFSFAFTPQSPDPEEFPMYTILAAAALVKVLEKYVPEPASIKWVNDIFYQGRKVSGILSEMGLNFQTDNTPYIVVGIGINFAGVFKQADEDVQAVAGTLFGEHIPHEFDQNHFLADFINAFLDFHFTFQSKNFLPIYEKHLLGIGEKVFYKMDGKSQSGVIKGINDKGNLLVIKEDESVEALVGQAIEFGSKQFVKDKIP